MVFFLFSWSSPLCRESPRREGEESVALLGNFILKNGVSFSFHPTATLPANSQRDIGREELHYYIPSSHWSSQTLYEQRLKRQRVSLSSVPPQPSLFHYNHRITRSVPQQPPPPLLIYKTARTTYQRKKDRFAHFLQGLYFDFGARALGRGHAN